MQERGERARAAFEAPWSEEAEQRVLHKVLDARRAQSPSRGAASTPRRVWALSAVAAAALLAIGALGSRLAVRRWPQSGTQSGTSVADSARLALPDGSEATMSEDGRVSLELAAVERVSLRQQRGTVTYWVRRNPARRFEVFAGSVHVTVRGTIFAVAMRAGTVEVSVTEGRVLVEDERTRVELTAGEHVSLRRADERASPALIAPDASAATEADGGASIEHTHSSGESNHRAIESVASLLDRVDSARSAGDNDAAAALLRRLLGRELSGAQRASASFTLARVERARGQHRAAAEALAECVARSPSGPLAEDATAEQALAWERVGDRARAERVASEYLRRWPQGAHLARLRHLCP